MSPRTRRRLRYIVELLGAASLGGECAAVLFKIAGIFGGGDPLTAIMIAMGFIALVGALQ